MTQMILNSNSVCLVASVWHLATADWHSWWLCHYEQGAGRINTTKLETQYLSDQRLIQILEIWLTQYTNIEPCCSCDSFIPSFDAPPPALLEYQWPFIVKAFLQSILVEARQSITLPKWTHKTCRWIWERICLKKPLDSVLLSYLQFSYPLWEQTAKSLSVQQEQEKPGSSPNLSLTIGERIVMSVFLKMLLQYFEIQIGMEKPKHTRCHLKHR